MTRPFTVEVSVASNDVVPTHLVLNGPQDKSGDSFESIHYGHDGVICATTDGTKIDAV